MGMWNGQSVCRGCGLHTENPLGVLVLQGAEEVDFFCIVNAQNFEKECLPWMKKFNPGSASHVSGLFRKTPFPAPRYQAVAWHVLSDLVKGKLSVGEGFRFCAGQCAVSLSSDAGELLIFWNGGETPVRIDGEDSESEIFSVQQSLEEAQRINENNRK